MTDERMALRTLLEKSADATFLREMIGFAANRLMELETETLCGAAHGERSDTRRNQRNEGTAVVRKALLPVGSQQDSWHLIAHLRDAGKLSGKHAFVRVTTHDWAGEVTGASGARPLLAGGGFLPQYIGVQRTRTLGRKMIGLGVRRSLVDDDIHDLRNECEPRDASRVTAGFGALRDNGVETAGLLSEMASTGADCRGDEALRRSGGHRGIGTTRQTLGSPER